MADDFEWASPLGIGVVLFLAIAAVYLLIGVLTPLVAFGSTAGRSILFVSTSTDTALYGASPESLLTADKDLAQLRQTTLTAIAGLLVGLGIVVAALAWFGVGGGHRWAIIDLAVSGAVMLPFWLLVVRPYIAAGVPLSLGDLPPFMWVPAALLLPATILSWVGLR